MDIEFHYYITYLTAVKAGINPENAFTIAYSSQYVDDNDILFEIEGDSNYQNYISQTFNIRKPQKKLQRIYPLFHFIPGEIDKYSNKLKKECPPLTTTPNNKYANLMIDKALESENPYKIGIATHAYLDTWSHQNFIGLRNYYNKYRTYAILNLIPDFISNFFLTLGHVNANKSPDIPNVNWKDPRLKASTINNNERFIEAIKNLFDKLSEFTGQSINPKINKGKKDQLIQDIEKIITTQDSKDKRITAYNQLVQKSEYGGKKLTKYNKYLWFNESICGEYPSDHDIELFYQNFNVQSHFKDYVWDDLQSYQETNWFKFQEAVKDHQEMMINILDNVIDQVKEIDEW